MRPNEPSKPSERSRPRHSRAPAKPRRRQRAPVALAASARAATGLVLALSLAALPAPLAAADAETPPSDDALFDMARQTDSLQEAYALRVRDPRRTFQIGIDAFEFQDYPVITEFGTADYGILIGYSYLRLDLPQKASAQPAPFRLRGFDWSGKSVALGKAFTVEGVGFSELQGEVSTNDMFLGLFSAWIVDFDLGFVRTRNFGDATESRVFASEGGEAIALYFTPQGADEYAAVFGFGSGRLFDVRMRVTDTLDSLKPVVSVPETLRLFALADVPAFVERGDLWLAYNARNPLIGAAVAVARFTEEIVVTPGERGKDDTEESYTSGGRATALAEFSLAQGAFDNARAEGEARYRNWFLALGGSYTYDPLLLPYGSPDGSALGYRVALGYAYKDWLIASVTVTENYVEYLDFMSGAYGHTIVLLSVSCRM